MANERFLSASELDFDRLKTNLRKFLEGQEQFKDYDFEGSNLSALLDVLTYNTHLNALYLNFIGSEMFLDTSTLRESIVSHAKELNYIPQSKLSASANVTFIVNTATSNAATIPTTVTIPKFFEITTTVGDNNYIFTTTDDVVISSVTEGSDGIFRFIANNISVFEGNIRTEVFQANVTSETASAIFKLSSANVDTRSIEVVVQNSNTDTTNATFLKAESLLGLDSTSESFFLQGAEEFKYEIAFGNGVTGKALQNGNLVKVTYRDCSADEPNNANTFSTSSLVNGYTTTLTVNEKATSGADEESIDSIKFNAPRAFATQGRAVTITDYKTLVTGEFPQYSIVNVYGGDEQTPTPLFGKAIVVVKPTTGTVLTQTEKDNIENFLKPRTPLSIDPIVLDAEFLFVEVTSAVTFNSENTTKDTNQIVSDVRNAITTFNTNNLGNFGSILRFSKFTTAIDAADTSIIGNETTLRAVRRITPNASNTFVSQAISFNNPLLTADVLFELPAGHESIVESSGFTYNSVADCKFVDNGLGTMQIVKDEATGRSVKLGTAGTVDYTTGIVSINEFTVNSYLGTSLRFFGRLENKDVVSDKNIILEVSDEDIIVTATGITE